MSKVVQEALRNALDVKSDKLAYDVTVLLERFKNERVRGLIAAPGNFTHGVKHAFERYESACAEIDTAMQRDRDADR